MNFNIKKTGLKVLRTSDYAMFGTVQGNRNPYTKSSEKHIQALKKSFNEQGYLYTPIIVNEKYEVIDGQHRLAAAKLADPTRMTHINYIVIEGYGLKEVKLLNMFNPKWQYVDFLTSYLQSSPIYQAVERFRKQSDVQGFSQASLLRLFCCDSTLSYVQLVKAFKEGRLGDVASDAVSVQKYITYINDFVNATGFTRLKQDAFVSAYLIISKDPDYVHGDMITRAQREGSFNRNVNIKGYIDQFRTIYNKYRRSTSTKINLGEPAKNVGNATHSFNIGGKIYRYKVADLIAAGVTL